VDFDKKLREMPQCQYCGSSKIDKLDRHLYRKHLESHKFNVERQQWERLYGTTLELPPGFKSCNACSLALADSDWTAHQTFVHLDEGGSSTRAHSEPHPTAIAMLQNEPIPPQDGLPLVQLDDDGGTIAGDDLDAPANLNDEPMQLVRMSDSTQFDDGWGVSRDDSKKLWREERKNGHDKLLGQVFFIPVHGATRSRRTQRKHRIGCDFELSRLTVPVAP
jgi:hypothetical protein